MQDKGSVISEQLTLSLLAEMYLLAFTLLIGRHDLMLRGCNFCFIPFAFKIGCVFGFLRKRSHSNTAGVCEDFLSFSSGGRKNAYKNTCVPVSDNLFFVFVACPGSREGI